MGSGLEFRRARVYMTGVSPGRREVGRSAGDLMVPVIRSEELAPPTDWRPTPSGRSVNPFRLTSSFPGRAMALSPNTESSSRLSTPSIPLRCRCCCWPLSAVRGRSVKPESVKRVSFSFSPLRFQCAVAQRFPELDAAHPDPRPLAPLTNGSRPVTGRPVASRRGDRWRVQEFVSRAPGVPGGRAVGRVSADPCASL